MSKNLLYRVHFLTLCLVILSTLMDLIFNLQIVQNVLFCIKVVVIISGVLIAVLFFKSLSWKRFYFLIYPIGIFAFILGYIVKGIFGALLMSITMFPVIKDEISYKNKDVIIYTKYTGFLSMCCTYTASENKYLIFEKNYGEFRVEGQTRLNIKTIENSAQQLKIIYEDFVYDELKNDIVLKDTTLVFNK